MFPRFISVKTHCFHQKILSLHYQIKYSPITSNLFTRPLIHLSTCHVTLSQTYLVPVSALCYSPNLFICYLVFYSKQPVHPSTCQLVNLPCYSPNLFICYLVFFHTQLVNLSTCQLVNLQCYSPNLFICYLVFFHTQLVHQSTRQPC